METKDVILQLRNRENLSQEELAEKLFVTRQAVSRWENGETLPNTETLKRLSALFDVSINTLLASPRRNICQCCGMPLEDEITSREPDGSFNEEYCKWCYSGGEFKYESAEQLIDFCVEHMATEAWPAEQVRAHMEAVVPQLRHWKIADCSLSTGMSSPPKSRSASSTSRCPQTMLSLFACATRLPALSAQRSGSSAARPLMPFTTIDGSSSEESSASALGPLNTVVPSGKSSARSG